MSNYQLPQPPQDEEDILITINQMCDFLRILNDRINNMLITINQLCESSRTLNDRINNGGL